MKQAEHTEMAFKQAERYWLNKLKNTNMSAIYSPDVLQLETAGKKDVFTLAMPAELRTALEKLSKGNDMAKLTLLLAAQEILYCKYSSSEAVLIFSGAFKNTAGEDNRDHALFYGAGITGSTTGMELLQHIQAELGTINSFPVLPAGELLQKYQELELGQKQALLQLGFYYNKLHAESSLYEKVNLAFEFYEDEKQLVLKIRYDKGIYNAAFAQVLAGSYIYVLQQLMQRPKQQFSAIEVLDADQRRQVISEWNNTVVEVDYSKTTISAFYIAAEKNAEKVAVVSGNTKLTYRELNEQSNRLAHWLVKNHKVGNGHFVGIILERTEWIPIAVMAVLKTGATYVPIDMTAPAERKQFILEDSNCTIVLTEKNEVEDIGNYWKGTCVSVISVLEETKNDLNTTISNEHSAYITYTSGSTGRPKGVIQTHKCLTNLLQWQLDKAELVNGLKVLQFASLGFDNSIQELLYAFLSGGTLYMISDEERKNMDRLAAFIIERGLEYVWVPVSVINSMFDPSITCWKEKNELKYLVSSGEQLNIGNSLSFFLSEHPDIVLFNYYGPSETHVVTMFTVKDCKVVKQSIGKPISNTQIYILNKSLQPVPAGVLGEAYIAGDGVAIGYLNLPELSAEKFLADPFNGGVMYRSGDIAKWLPDGTIEYMGRNDDQVKIRGNRVEIGEIENALLKHADIKEAVVLANDIEGKGEKELVAYFICTQPVILAELQQFLLLNLPDFMVPSYYVMMEQFPLNGNGKVDKKNLPDPRSEEANTGAIYEAPRNETETKLVDLWLQVLSRKKIGVKDNFFLVGGHSLRATRLVSHIYKEFGITLDLRTIFTLATIEEQAKEINARIWVNAPGNDTTNTEEEITI